MEYIAKGEPRDLGAAKALAENRYQFQWWALSLVGGINTLDHSQLAP